MRHNLSTMRLSTGLIMASALALSACSENPNEATSVDSVEADMAGEMQSVSEPAADAVAAPEGGPEMGETIPISQRPDMPINLPKMAYIFDYGFRLPGQDIPALQQRHADMCEAQGPYSCQIISMSRSGEDAESSYGSLQLAVVADKARAFGTQLSEAAVAAGGDQLTANIAGEDLSKQMVDTEAHLRSRIALRDRLLELLKTRQGPVADLVEAERNVAAINQEIDQAQSWLTEMRGRVSYSRVNLAYESTTPVSSDFLAPVRAVMGSLGTIMGTMLAIAILLGAIGLPILLGVFGVKRLRRRLGWSKKATAS